MYHIISSKGGREVRSDQQFDTEEQALRWAEQQGFTSATLYNAEDERMAVLQAGEWKLEQDAIDNEKPIRIVYWNGGNKPNTSKAEDDIAALLHSGYSFLTAGGSGGLCWMVMSKETAGKGKSGKGKNGDYATREFDMANERSLHGDPTDLEQDTARLMEKQRLNDPSEQQRRAEQLRLEAEAQAARENPHVPTEYLENLEGYDPGLSPTHEDNREAVQAQADRDADAKADTSKSSKGKNK